MLRKRNFGRLLEGVVVVWFVQSLVSNYGVDGRHISLKRQNRHHRSGGERIITEDAVTVEALPHPSSQETSPSTSATLLRAGYAQHLRQNLKKALALQLLHQSHQNEQSQNQQQNQYNKNPTSDEFMSHKNKKPNKKLRLYKQLSAGGSHISFFPSIYDRNVPDEVALSSGFEDDNDEMDESASAPSDDSGDEDEKKFNTDVSHFEEDPHFYQERYESIGGGGKGKGQGQGQSQGHEDDEQEQWDDMHKENNRHKGFSLANSYFDNEYSISMLHKMECVTPTKSKGYCSTFRSCVPSLFTPSGELQTPALAELVSMSIGYCSASAPSSDDGHDGPTPTNSNHLLKRTGQRYAAVANRIICCPGTPPPPGTSAEETSAEKFNDFLAGSESFMEQDEDDVNQGPSPRPHPPSMGGMGNKQKNVSDAPNGFVNGKGEFVQDNPDTEAEVWHSEEDIKAAKNRKPANVIPIEAFIPPDKLAQYDPHTNTFSKEVFEQEGSKVNGGKDKGQSSMGESPSPNEIKADQPTLAHPTKDDTEVKLMVQKPVAPIMSETDDEFMTENYDHNNQGSLPSVENSPLDPTQPPHDEGIISGESQGQGQIQGHDQIQAEDQSHDDPTPVGPDLDNVQPTSAPTTPSPIAEDIEESVTITTTTISVSSSSSNDSHGENSTFIQIQPEPVIGVNGKFTLDKGVVIEKGTGPPPRPPPDPAHQVNIAQTPVNIIKAGETTVDSNQVVLLRPGQNRPEGQQDAPEESSHPDVEEKELTSQSIAIVQLSQGDEPKLAQDTPENFQIPETTTDPYNQYQVHQNVEIVTESSPIYTTPQNLNEVEIQTTAVPVKDLMHADVNYSESGEYYNNLDKHPTTIMPHLQGIGALAEEGGKFDTVYPGTTPATTIIPEGQQDDEWHPDGKVVDDSPQVTTEYPKPAEVDSTTSKPNDGGYGHDESTHQFQNDEPKFPETTTTRNVIQDDESSGESTTFFAPADFVNTNSLNDEPGESQQRPETVVKVPIVSPSLHDGPSNDLSVTSDRSQTTPVTESETTGNPNSNLLDQGTNFVASQSQDTPQENPITLLFPIDAATRSPQNIENSSENGLPSQTILSESKDPTHFPSGESDKQPEVSSTDNSSNYDEEKKKITLGSGKPFESTKIKGVSNFEETKSQISSEQNVSGQKQKEKVPQLDVRPSTTPPTPTEPEPELGGLGPSMGSLDGQSEYQILSACASQDYYRSLEEESLRQYPYLATIVGGSRPFCSGTLITDRHILTASHFLSNITVADVFHMRVHMGYKTAFDGTTEGPAAVRKVLKVIRHKGFSFDKLLNDVAILLLDRPVRFNEDIHPVCLSNSHQLYSNGVTRAYETGWVEDPLMKKISPHHPFVDPHVLKYFSFGYKNVTWTLQQSSARVKTKEDCSSNYEFLEKSGIYISDSMVCAATEDGKSCSFKGNSGAPLFINRDNKVIQIGLVSWGIGCGHFPAVFTSTSKYLPWIEKVVQRTR